MPTASRTRASLALLGALAAPALATAQTAERHTLSGSSVAVYNVAGRVRLVAGSGGGVVVEVARHGADAGQLRVEKGPIDGRETLRVIYPDDRVVYPELGRSSRTQSRVRADGTFGGGREIEVRGDGRGLEAWADLTVSVPTGQRLALHLMAGDVVATNVNGDLTIDVHSASVRTERTRGRLAVDAGSGTVRVNGADGDVSLDTGSGSVEVRDVRGGRLDVDAGSGSMTGENIDVPALSLDLGSGRTRLGGVRARELRVDAGSGGVEVGLLNDVDDVRIDAGSGTVTLRLPADVGAEVEIETGSGGIETELPLVVTRRSRDRLVGRLGDGRGRISIETGSGGVRLLRGS